jgi:hypothetical protein
MKTKNLALALLAVIPLRLLMADDVPEPYTFARYQAMMDRSPFAVATAVAAPAATPNFAKDLYVANAAHSKDGDFVTIASSADKSFKKYLTTDTPEDGYSISNIEWSDKVGATKVTIAKDGQTATLTFNEALLKTTAAAAELSAASRAGAAVADTASARSGRHSKKSASSRDALPGADAGSGIVGLVRSAFFSVWRTAAVPSH